MEIPSFDWKSIIKNDADVLEALKQKHVYCIALVASIERKTPEEIPRPQIFYGSIKEKTDLPVLYVPPIAEHKDGVVIVYKEILKDTVDSIDAENCDKFIESVILHEAIHHVLRHKADTKEQRKIAETQAHGWMQIYANDMYIIFNKFMPIVDTISEKNSILDKSAIHKFYQKKS